MPVSNLHYAVIKIEGNPQLQRYISLEKLVSMLHRRCLFFTRVDRLEDQFEGTSPAIAKKILKNVFENIRATDFFKPRPSDERLDEMVLEEIQQTEKMRALYVVNCWHCREYENALMWKSYSSSNSGVMIKTDYNALVESFASSEENLQTSKVSYRDYDNDYRMPVGNGIFPIIHKRQFYSDEAEIRIIHQVSNKMWVHDWANEECQDGIYIKADIDKLINEIRVAPFAPNWYLEAVKSVCEKFGVTKPILRSSLAK